MHFKMPGLLLLSMVFVTSQDDASWDMISKPGSTKRMSWAEAYLRIQGNPDVFGAGSFRETFCSESQAVPFCFVVHL